MPLVPAPATHTARLQLAARRPIALAVAIGLSAALAACGGGRHAGASVGRQPGATRSSLSGPFRWLVPTLGQPPAIAVENGHPGTRAWRLPGPTADVGGVAYGAVEGYVAQQAVSSGQVQRIYVDAPGAPSVRIRIFRMGWYGGTGGRLVLISSRLAARTQPSCTHRFQTGLTECRWHPTLSFTIPSALPSGVYIAQMSVRGGASDCLFVVRAATPQPLIAQLPTSTYEAYNAWGGDSLYPGGADRVGLTGSTQGVEVSYDRPYGTITGAGEFFARDVAMVQFLERYGYPVSYTTSESVDSDPSQLAGHKAVIDFGHSEYWSARQASAFAGARDAGTSLLFFSSDTFGWRVRYAAASTASSQAGAPDHVIVGYKEHAALDPSRSQPTGIFPARGATLTGSSYLGCITTRVPGPGPPTYLYYPWRPAPGLQPSWLFAATGIDARTEIRGIVGYELDQRTALSPAGTELAGYGVARCMSVGAGEPGEPTPTAGDDLAETMLYKARSGALVFSTGTLGWELGLEPVPSASPDAPRAPDSRVVAMTRNLLAHVLAG